MRYLLTTVHKHPKFYAADGSIVEVELKYVEHKKISSIDENGQLNHRKIGGPPPVVGNIWMVNSIEDSLRLLETLGVYPFESKASAKLNAKRLGLQTFKYLPVP